MDYGGGFSAQTILKREINIRNFLLIVYGIPVKLKSDLALPTLFTLPLTMFSFPRHLSFTLLLSLSLVDSSDFMYCPVTHDEDSSASLTLHLGNLNFYLYL
jgi:hypothetical protein